MRNVFDSVAHPALQQTPEIFVFAWFGRDNQFATLAVRDAALGAIAVQHAPPLYAVPGF